MTRRSPVRETSSEDAIPTAREAVTIFRLLGDRHREGIALGHIAIALQATGQATESIAAYRDIVAVMRKAGDRRGEGVTLINLGYALQEAGMMEEAITAEEEAANILGEIGDRGGEGTALNNLGGILRLLDRECEAIAVLRKAVDALADGDAHAHGAALVNLGQALLVVGGHGDEAIRVFTDAGIDYRETRDRNGEGIAEQHRGQALQAAGRSDDAAEAFRSAAAIFREVGDRLEEGRALDLLGSVIPEAQRDEAIAAFEDAVALFQEIGEQEMERAATSRLLSLRFPVPSAAEMRAQIDAGSMTAIAPGLWVDVRRFDGQEDEETRRITQEVLARMRKAAADAVDEPAPERGESADLPTSRHARSQSTELGVAPTLACR